MPRLRAAGLALGVAVVLYIPAVAVWAAIDGASASSQHRTTTAATAATAATDGKGSHASRHRDTTIRGTRQVLHVAVPGTRTTRDVIVYRPDVPDSASLPVLYVLHGSPGAAGDPFAAGLPQIVDRLVAAGYPPFVLAAPDGNGTKHPDTEWANAVDGTDQFETFVTKDVIDAVEGANRRDRSRRAIAGFSMGAYGAVNLAMRHPDLYGQVVALAGYFHVDDPSGVFGHELAAIDANTPELHLANARRERLLVVDGDQGNDRVVKGESKLFVQQLVAAHVPVSYELIPGGHSWSFVASAFPDVARFLDADWSTLRPAPPEPPMFTRHQATGRWQGKESGATVDVALVAATDPRVQRLEAVRTLLGAGPVSYVVVTIDDAATASAAYSLSKVSFVDRAGRTVDANPVPAVLDEWLTASARPRDRADGGNAPNRRDGPSPQAAAAVRAAERGIATSTSVAPGHSTTAVLVTTSAVHGVELVFVGDSYGDETLTRVG
ncbi:MAG TPA: alpha/beta hydrolase-fold protein [Acidimicrobiia bacterium]|nr:alpha/beta hydrolase-fold protein [Acidimicrobiia bacterium]